MTAVAMRSGPVEGVFAREGSTPAKSIRPPPSLPEVVDLQSALFAAQATMKDTRSKSALMSADGAQLARDHAVEQARAAVAKAQQEMRDAEEKGELIKTLRTVGTIAAVVVAAASIVCSAGISTPGAIALVGVALSVSSPYVAEAGHEKLALAMAVAGAVASLGAGIYSSLVSTTTTTLTAAQQATVVAAKATVASTQIAGGVATIKKGSAEARAQDARADAITHRANAQQEQAIVDDAIALLNEVETKSRRAIASILAVGQSASAARGTVISHMRRA